MAKTAGESPEDGFLSCLFSEQIQFTYTSFLSRTDMFWKLTLPPKNLILDDGKNIEIFYWKRKTYIRQSGQYALLGFCFEFRYPVGFLSGKIQSQWKITYSS